ncbi:MAG: GNAT family N-acetyltransferase [Clostridia bacterium]|nr:GNAT family N-acetyltransferase [Clostridia bacterium]
MAAEVTLLTAAHPLWEALCAYAARCPWQAGPYLAREMAAGRFAAWERVAALRVDGEIAGFCTFTAQDELPEEYGFSPFIGFVYVEEGRRGRRYSQRMLEAVERYAASCGFAKVYLMSAEKGLYEKYGYRPLGEYSTIWGTRDQLFEKPTEDLGEIV